MEWITKLGKNCDSSLTEIDFSQQNRDVLFMTRLRFLVSHEDWKERKERLERFRTALCSNSTVTKLIIRSSFLTHLDLLSVTAFVDLLALPQLCHVQELELRGDGRSTLVSAFALARLLKGRGDTLQKLSITSCSLQPVSSEALLEVCQAVVSLRELTHLRWHVTKNEITSALLRCDLLSNLVERDLPKLRSLEVFLGPQDWFGHRRLHIPPQTLEKLAGSLHQLKLVSHTFRQDDAHALAQTLRLPDCQLEVLDLTDCSIPMVGCHALLWALHVNKQLRVLNLKERHSPYRNTTERLEELDWIIGKGMVEAGNTSLQVYVPPSWQHRNRDWVPQINFFLGFNKSKFQGTLPMDQLGIWSLIFFRLTCSPQQLYTVLCHHSHHLGVLASDHKR